MSEEKPANPLEMTSTEIIEELMELVRIVEEMRKNRMNKDYELAMDKSKELARKYG